MFFLLSTLNYNVKDASCSRQMLVELKGEIRRRVIKPAFVYGVEARAATKGEAMIFEVNETTC